MLSAMFHRLMWTHFFYYTLAIRFYLNLFVNSASHLSKFVDWMFDRNYVQNHTPTTDFMSLVYRKLRHDDVIKWKHFPRYWPFVQGIHRSPVNSPHKGQWHGALMFSLISTRINGWVNNGEAGDLRRHRAHYGVTVMVAAYCKGKHCFC